MSWPGGTWNLQRGHIAPHATQTWYGSVSMGQQDRTGLLYQRNRYYDSSTGQFTRQDPIGIAGGLNLYGYANGDPVNFHDPFGLDCEEKDEPGTQALSKECDEDGVVIVGIQGSAVFGVRPVGSVGVAIDGEDSGLYGRIGIHFGLNTSIGGETGVMDEEALTGASLEMCAGGATGDACVLLAPTEDGGLSGGFGAGGGGPALGISPVTVDAGGSVGGRLSFTRLMNGLRKIFTPPDCPKRLQRCGG